MAGRRSRRTSTPAAELPSELPPEEEEEEEEEEESDFEPVEPNLATRVKRSNAGNRMRALLDDEQGAEAEELFKEEVDDVEFKQKEEADVFDSDFGSTDEGSAGEDDEDAGERKLENEAKAEKKAAKAKKKKGFVAPTHPFARTTKDQARKAAKAAQPVASTSASTLDDDGVPVVKRKRGSIDPAFLAPMRESSRRSAVEFKKGVKDRLVESEKRKAVATKPRRRTQKTLTQADLIAEALETEEINRAALLAFYAAEEDRREAERIAGMRYEIIGPKLTFLSRTEGSVAKKDKGKGKEELGRKRMIEVLGETGQKGWKAGANENGGAASSDNSTSINPQPDENNPPTNSVDQSSSTNQPISRQRDPAEPLPWTRNWLVFDNFEGNRADEYEALFGEHVDWSQPVPPRDDPKLNRCALTGLPARYRDPRTLTPYASLEAYQVLNSIVDAQAFIWSDSLGAYTGTSGFGLAREVEQAWSRRPQAKTRYAASTDAPPLLLPMAAPPAPRVIHGTRSASAVNGALDHQVRPRIPKEDNPYSREYASSGGTGRGTRGRSSISQHPDALPALPSAFPPLPVSNGFPPLPLNTASPHQSQQQSPHTAPQARSIQLSSNGGFGSPSPFGPASPHSGLPLVPSQSTGSSPAPNANGHVPSPALPPLPPQ